MLEVDSVFYITFVRLVPLIVTSVVVVVEFVLSLENTSKHDVVEFCLLLFGAVTMQKIFFWGF
jgi:hypothetical protein